MLEKVYRDFCGTNDYQPTMKKPFYQRGRTIATNGHVMISSEGKLLECPEVNSPDACKVIDECLPSEEQFEVECLKIIDFIIENSPLVHVEGETKCFECDGQGEKECDMGHDHECDECEGFGTLNTGIKAHDMPDPDQEFSFKGVKFRAEILLKILTGFMDLGFEKCTWYTHQELKSNLFVAGEFKIIGMPCFNNPKYTPIELPL